MPNQLTITLVVVLLGVFAIVGLAGTVWLEYEAVDASVVAGLAGTALGAIAALLASTHSQPAAPPNQGDTNV